MDSSTWSLGKRWAELHAIYAYGTTPETIYQEKLGTKPITDVTMDGGKQTIRTREESIKKGAEDMIHEFDIQQEADRLLLTTYVPASVVIDADMQILHVRGHTSPYLEPAPGRANFHAQMGP